MARVLGQAPGDLPDGRVSLYVCPECEDLGCGAITARVSRDGDTVTWHDLGWQTDYEPEIELADRTVTFSAAEFLRELHPA